MWDQRNSGIRNMVERGADALLSLCWFEVLPVSPAVAGDDDETTDVWPWLVSCK